MKRNQVFTLIDEMWPEEIEFLQKLVNFESTLHHELEVQQYITYSLKQMDLKVDVFDVDISSISKLPGYSPTDWSYEKKPQVVGVLKSDYGNGHSLVLNGHIDVVPAGTLSYWSYDPWAGTINGDRLYGRGAGDMKGGIAAMIYATKAIQKSGMKLLGNIILQVVTEEECTGNGALSCIARGYKGEGCLCPEPSEQKVGLGTIGILWLKTTVRGMPGHPFMGHLTINPIEKAYYLIQSLKKLENKWNKTIHPEFKSIQHPINFVTGTLESGQWTSMTPDNCIFTTRIGFYPGIEPEEAKKMIIKHLQKFINADPWLKQNPPEFKWFGFNCKGYTMNSNNEFIKTIASAHKKVTGKETNFDYSAGTSDVRFWPLYYNLPSCCYGPNGGNFHGHDEYVNLSSVLETTKVIAEFIMKWCGVANMSEEL